MLCFSLPNTNSVKRLRLLQEKTLRLMLFQSITSLTGPLFKNTKILKSFDKSALLENHEGVFPPVFNSFKKVKFWIYLLDRRQNINKISVLKYTIIQVLLQVECHLKAY